MFIVSFLSLPWNGRAPVSISYWKFTKAKTIRFWHCSFSRHGRKVNTWSQTNAGSKRAVNNMVLLNHTVRKKRLCNVVCGILVVSLPTSSETKFHLLQALCSAFALCQHGEAAFVCETELLWPSQTVCQWVYCNVFSISPNKWSKLCNRDITCQVHICPRFAHLCLKQSELIVCQVLALIYSKTSRKSTVHFSTRKTTICSWIYT